MAARSCRILACALWAFAKLASAYSDISEELKNGRDYGYSGSLKVVSMTAVREMSDGVFEVNNALVNIKAVDSNTEGHRIKQSINLYESKTDGPADWRKVCRLRKIDFYDTGVMEFYAGKLPGGNPLVLRTGYWYSIMFYSSKIKKHNCVVFLEPWQCPDLKPYTKREPFASDDSPVFVPTGEMYPFYMRHGDVIILSMLALCGYGIYRIYRRCYGSSKRGP